MFDRAMIPLFVAVICLLPACGGNGDDADDEIPAAEVRASDPEIPAEPGHFNGEWSAPDDSFSFSVGADQFEPPAGGAGGPGATFNYGETSSSATTAGGQLDILWSNPDEAAGDEDPSELRFAINYGLSGEFLLEPGTYEVSSAQTSDGTPWLNGSNDPSLRYSSSNRRNGNRKNAVLVIEEVTDTNMTGRVVITGTFFNYDGTFRLAVAFNAYRE